MFGGPGRLDAGSQIISNPPGAWGDFGGSGGYDTSPPLPGLPAAQVEHLIAAVRTPNKSSEMTYIDLDPGAATRALNVLMSHQPLDGLVVDVAALETPDLMLDVRGHDRNPQSVRWRP